MLWMEGTSCRDKDSKGLAQVDVVEEEEGEEGQG